MDTPRDDTQNQNAQHDAQKQQAENQQKEQAQKQEQAAAEQQQRQVAENYRQQHEANNAAHKERLTKEHNESREVKPHVQQEAKASGSARFGRSEWTSKGSEVMRAAQSTRYIGYEATRNQTLKTLPNEQARAAVLSRHAAAARAPTQPARGRGR